MPKFKYPAETRGVEVAGDSKPEKRQPRLYMPAGPEQIADLEIGQEVEVKLKGKVVGTSVRKDEGEPSNDANLDLELMESEVYPSKGKKKKKDEKEESPYEDLLEGE